MNNDRPNDLVTIEQAAADLGVDPDIFESFINKCEIPVTRIQDGPKLYRWEQLLGAYNGNPTLGEDKTLVRKLTPAISILRQNIIGSRQNTIIIGTSFFIATITFLASGFYFAAGVITGVLTNAFGNILSDKYKEKIQRHRDADEARRLFNRYFWQQNNWSIDYGNKYDHGGYHRDHVAGFAGILECEPSIGESNGLTISGETMNRPAMETHVLVGGPVSTDTVRHIWQYERGRTSGQSLKQVDAPILDLPFSFLIDNEHVLMERMGRLPRLMWSYADGSGYSKPTLNRPLIDRRNPGRFRIPDYGSKCHIIEGQPVYLPETNFLIITRIPNFLVWDGDDIYPQTWGSLVSIQATHGIGTRAAGLLLTDKGKEPLRNMGMAISTAIEDGYAFQAIFRVSNLEDVAGIEGYTNIEYEDAAVIQVPVEKYALLRSEIESKVGSALRWRRE